MIFRMGDINDWTAARELLQPAFCRLFHTDSIDDYFQPIKDNQAHLWIAEDDMIRGAAITTIEEGSNGKTCAVRFLGGSKLKQWSALMDEMLTKWARLNNCHQIEAYTRKGFSKLITSFKPSGLELYIKVV